MDGAKDRSYSKAGIRDGAGNIFPLFFAIFNSMMCDEFICVSQDEEWGNFKVSFYDDRTVAYITGLSELGQQQKSIAIPKEINGVKVYTIGKRTGIYNIKEGQNRRKNNGKI